MTVPEIALVRFRAVVAGANAATGAVRDVEQRLNDWHRHIARLRSERDRLAAARYFKPQDKDEQRAEVAAAAAAIADAEREAVRLAADVQRLQRRRDDVVHLACRCRDFLRDRNALPSELDF